MRCPGRLERLDQPTLSAGAEVGVLVRALLGPVPERRALAPALAQDLLSRADKLMYEAKGERTNDIRSLRVRLEKGALIELGPDEHSD